MISDPNATKSAAAMSVDVGAASDPDGLPGLAHFLEHMLFLGERKRKEVLVWPSNPKRKTNRGEGGGRGKAVSI